MCVFRDLPRSTSNALPCSSEQRIKRRQDEAGRNARALEQLIQRYAPSCPSGQRAQTSSKVRPRRKGILDLGVNTSVLVNVCWGMLVCGLLGICIRVCSVFSQEAQAMLYHAHQSSAFNGGRMRKAETHAHQSSGFNILLCLVHQGKERRRAIK